jgi:hypothetical protein
MILAGRGLAAASVAISPAPFGDCRCPSRRCARPASPFATPQWNRAVPLTTSSSIQLRERVGGDEAKGAVPAARRRRRNRSSGGVRNFNRGQGEGRLDEPGWSDADRLGRLGPLRSLGRRERVYKKQKRNGGVTESSRCRPRHA